MALQINDLRNLIKLDPEDPTLLFALGLKLYEEDKTPTGLAEAIDHLRKANQIAPRHGATYYVLAMALVDAREIEEARALLQRGILMVNDLPTVEGHDLIPSMQDLLESL